MNMIPYYEKNTTDEEKVIIKKHSCISFMPNISKITDKLYLGNYDSAMFKTNLKKLGITHILICGKDLEELYPKDFTYLTLRLDDSFSEDILSHFSRSIEFIDTSNIVLVHCLAGVSRSATIVIAYLMSKYKVKAKTAIEFVKNKRNLINPNINFRLQLEKYESDLSNLITFVPELII